MTRILVIEDDLAMQALMQEWLGSAGQDYAVEVGHLAHAPAPPSPDLIIASMVNLRGPGAIALQALRNQFLRVPLLVVSGQLGHSLSNQSVTAMSLGVSALLAKPFTRAELLEAVAEALYHGK